MSAKKYKTVGSFGDSTFPVEIHLDPNHLFGHLEPKK